MTTAVTWRSGGVALPYQPVIEDAALPHQLVLTLTSKAGHAGQIAVTCNCLMRQHGKGSGRGRPRQLIETRTLWAPGEARAAWMAWHVSKGFGLCPECGSVARTAAGNADAGITIFTCPSGHSWARANWDWERRRS